MRVVFITLLRSVSLSPIDNHLFSRRISFSLSFCVHSLSYVLSSPLTCTNESIMSVMEGWGCLSLISDMKWLVSMGMGLL
jgi:hypothetical protein